MISRGLLVLIRRRILKDARWSVNNLRSCSSIKYAGLLHDGRGGATLGAMDRDARRVHSLLSWHLVDNVKKRAMIFHSEQPEVFIKAVDD